MTYLVEWLFNPDTNPVFKLFLDAFQRLDHNQNIPQFTNDIYKFSIVAYLVFVVLSIWLSVKVISWFFRLLGYGGK